MERLIQQAGPFARLRPARRIWLVSIAAILLPLAWPADQAMAIRPGALTQLPAPGACVSDSGSGGVCANGRALADPNAVTVSPDKENAYVASEGSSAVLVFSRNTQTGALTQLSGKAGCVSEDGRSKPDNPATAGHCEDGRALDSAREVSVSPDGKNVYVASFDERALAVFRRNQATGELTQLGGAGGCVSETGSDGCLNGRAVTGAAAVTVSPDPQGKHVYLGSFYSDAVAIFSRNQSNGALTQLTGTARCVSETGRSDPEDPDTAGHCANGRALDGVTGIAVSADGENAYSTGTFSHGIAVFSRNETTGALAQLQDKPGCVSGRGPDVSPNPATAGVCKVGRGLGGAGDVAASGDGQNVYVAGLSDSAVAAFSRNQATGALTQLADTAGCVQDQGSSGAQCASGKAISGPTALSIKGRSVYVAAFGSDAVASFSRALGTGELVQLPDKAGCVSQTGRSVPEFPGTAGDCRNGRALAQPSDVAVSPNGASVYATAAVSDAVAAFAREPAQ